MKIDLGYNAEIKDCGVEPLVKNLSTQSEQAKLVRKEDVFKEKLPRRICLECGDFYIWWWTWLCRYKSM